MSYRSVVEIEIGNPLEKASIDAFSDKVGDFDLNFSQNRGHRKLPLNVAYK